jgi:tRNA-splicing ligase RtcB
MWVQIPSPLPIQELIHMKVLSGNHRPIKMWTDYVPVNENALEQLKNIAQMPFIYRHVAVMPDVHLGKGATVGSVIATKGAIIPAAVGVDIGCGMTAVKTSLKAKDLPDNLAPLRSEIEKVIPVGEAIHKDVSNRRRLMYNSLNSPLFNHLLEKYPKIKTNRDPVYQIGSLGGGNHFIELCLDENQDVWIMLHSGSRGIGNSIGRFFIERAKEDMKRYFINLPDQDLAYIPEGSVFFEAYCFALEWAQAFASLNRQSMLVDVIEILERNFKGVKIIDKAISCHHNYVEKENHFGQNIWITRKGAVRARDGDLGIIPGSMGAKSFIVRGLGNTESFCSCSHGAGRVMSRNEAKKLVNIEDHIKDTSGVECRKDVGVIDETPKAYKNIDDVMKSQEDLVEIVYTLKQVLCVKG